MGLSDIAKAPVSHGVEPHDLETGPSLPVVLTRTPSPLARRPYRASGLVPLRNSTVHWINGRSGPGSIPAGDLRAPSVRSAPKCNNFWPVGRSCSMFVLTSLVKENSSHVR